MKAWPRITTLAVRFGLESAHRSQPGLEPAVVAFDPVVLVMAGAMPRGRNQVLDHVGQCRWPVGDDLARVTVNSQGSGEEPTRGGDVSALRHVHVDHLAMLVDRPVDVGPDPGDLDVGLVDEPPIPGQVPDRPGRVDQQRREPLHPPIEGHVVDLDATLGEKLFEVPVGQPVTEVPAHRQQDHLGRESEASEPRGHPHRRFRTASALHRATLTATVRSVNATEPAWVPGIGLAWDLVTTMTASYQKVLSSNPKIGYLEQRSTYQAAIDDGEVLAPATDMDQSQTIVTNSTVNGTLQSIFAILVIIIVANALVIWVKAIRAGGLPTTEVPATPSDFVAPSDFFATKEEKESPPWWRRSP